MDKYAFILGMITAFCECVAGGCKRMALSPPLTSADYGAVSAEAEKIIEKHGLVHYHEMNLDRPAPFDWIVIAAKRETIEQYKALRQAGCSPAVSLKPFSELLSYNEKESVHTGYDAFREYFPI